MLTALLSITAIFATLTMFFMAAALSRMDIGAMIGVWMAGGATLLTGTISLAYWLIGL